MWNRSVRFTLLTLALAVAIPAAAMAQAANTTAQVAQPPEEGVDWSGVGIGAATVVADVVYVPTKVVYAILGGIGGGAGWALTGGNSQVSDTIWRSSLGGDYVLTPGMVRGDEPIHFSGPTETSGKNSGMAAQAANGGAYVGTASAGSPSTKLSSNASTPLSVVPANSSASAQPIDGGAGPVRGTASADHGLGIE